MHINDVFIWEIILFLYGFSIVHGSLYKRGYHVDTTLAPRWDKTILDVQFRMQVHDIL